MYIDGSVYPDVDPPLELVTPEDKADYLHRICSAWDFGIDPEDETVQLLSGWKEVFDRYPIAASPAYHVLRAWYGWEPVPRPRDITYPEPWYVALDRTEDRDDPCEHMV